MRSLVGKHYCDGMDNKMEKGAMMLELRSQFTDTFKY
jgi:hypothetical protein